MSAWASVPTQARPLAFGGCTEPGGTLSMRLDASCTPTCTHALDAASSRNSPPRSYNVAEPPVRPGAAAHRFLDRGPGPFEVPTSPKTRSESGWRFRAHSGVKRLDKLAR